MEIEGLMVEISYEYYNGSSDDDSVPPTSPIVDIKSWRLVNGERQERYKHPDYTDEEWDEWMDDIDTYVHEDSLWDIIEFEESFK